MKKFFNLMLSGCALSSTLTLAAGDDIHKLAELNRTGPVDQAYALAAQLLPDWEADPQFDRQYARAAMAAGQVGEAIFALERLLLLDPHDNGTRAELARAYALLGSQPLLHADVATASSGQTRLEPGFNGFVAAGLGYGENLDAGPDRNHMMTPSGEVFVDGLRQRDDTFGSLRAGLRYRFPLSESWQAFADGRLAGRFHQDADDLDSLSASLRAGGIRSTSSGRLQVAVQAQHYRLDDRRRLDSHAISVDYLHVINNDLTAGPFVSLSRQDHALAELDSRLWLVGGKLNWRVQHQLGPVFYTGIYGGNESPRNASAAAAGRADRDLWAGYLGVRLEPDEKLWVNAEAVRVSSRFKGPLQLVVPATANPRRDDFTELKLDIGWRFDQRWSTQISYVFHDNDSNTRLLKYQRQQTELTLRYEF